MTLASSEVQNSFHAVIDEIGQLNWAGLTEDECLDAACAYYWFSVQFRENLQVACRLFPGDDRLQHLAREECNTDNLSPFDGVAAPGEKMNHDEFMRRLLLLSPVAVEHQRDFEPIGEAYLAETRSMDPMTRALSIASYEDGGLEQVFRGMTQMPVSTNPALRAFRHFLVEHIRFDSDPNEGHGALSRHLVPDDRILPLWTAFRDLFCRFVPALAERNEEGTRPEVMVPAFKS